MRAIAVLYLVLIGRPLPDVLNFCWQRGAYKFLRPLRPKPKILAIWSRVQITFQSPTTLSEGARYGSTTFQKEKAFRGIAVLLRLGSEQHP